MMRIAAICKAKGGTRHLEGDPMIRRGCVVDLFWGRRPG